MQSTLDLARRALSAKSRAGVLFSGGEVELWLVASGAFAQLVLTSVHAAADQKQQPRKDVPRQDLSPHQLLAVMVYRKVRPHKLPAAQRMLPACL